MNTSKQCLLLLFLSMAFLRAGTWCKNIAFPLDTFNFRQLDGYDIIDADEHDFYAEKVGFPMIPKVFFNIIVPLNATITRAECIPLDSVILSGKYYLYPIQYPRCVSDTDSIVFVQPNDSLYALNTYYPGKMTEISRTGTKDGFRIGGILIFPLQYLPASRTVKIYTHVKLEIEWIDDYDNEITLTAKQYAAFAEEVKSIVINPQDVENNHPPIISERNESYDLLIITSQTLANASYIQELVNWKTKTGLGTIVKTPSDFSSLSGRDDAEKMRNFIKYYFDNYGIQYVLLIGDIDILPYRLVEWRSSDICSDLYFSALEGNWDGNNNSVFGEAEDDVDLYADIHIGRIPVENITELLAYYNKWNTYEKNPPAVYLTKILLPAIRLFTDPAYYGDIINNYIAYLFPDNWQKSKLYQTSGNLNEEILKDSLNVGFGLVHIASHGCYSAFVYQSGSNLFTTITADALINYPKNGILVSIACNVGEFNYLYENEDCIAEHLINNNNGGFVACVVNSKSGWCTPPTMGPSENLDYWLFHRINNYRLGNALSLAKYLYVPLAYALHDTRDTLYRYCIYGLTLLGDPTLYAWTDIPQTLSLDWPGNAEWGQIYPVYVHDAQYNPLSDAFGCIWNENTGSAGIHITGYSGNDGKIYLGPIPSGLYEGSADLTVTKHNYKPNLKQINIIAIKSPNFLNAISPNMVSIKLTWQDFSGREAGFIIARKVDNGAWNNSWKDIPQSNLTQYIDTDVQFGHEYTYKVRCYDTGYQHFSNWSNEVVIVCGTIARSSYSKMSAFNNGAKTIRYGNNVYTACIIGDWGERELCCLRSTDGGNSFISEPLPIPGYNANGCHCNPAIAVTSTGTPYVVWGSIYWSGEKGTAGWFRGYFCSYWLSNQWHTCDIYAHKMNEISGWYPIEDSLSPPSFAITAGFPSDSGYILFKNKNDASNMQMVSFVLSNPAASNFSSVPGSNNSAQFPSIGIDRGDINNPSDDRLFVIGYDYIPANYSGPLKLYYRTIGQSSSWQSLSIPNCTAFGTPALWAGNDKARITFEGDDGQNFGLVYLSFIRSGTAYIPQNPEIVTANIDCSPEGIEGYTYLASKDLVMWKYLDDIYCARRLSANTWQALGNLSSTLSNVSSYPQGFVTGGITRPKLFALWTEKVGTSYYLVRKIINLPSANQNITQITESEIPEATAYNNAHRMLKDNNGILHLVFTNGDNIYYTVLQDTVWSEPGFLGEGKYPALAMGADGKLYCIWCYHGYQEFEGMPYYVEYLRMRSYNGVSWSKPTKLLFHTYGTYLWGVGAPSLAVKDTMAYVTFKSYHGPTINPTPGEPYPHIVVVEGPALIYGTFALTNPDAFAYQIIDTIIKTPNPVDTLTYRDSLVPLLISPSITNDLAGITHILWEGDSTAMRYYTITDSMINRQLFDINTSNNVDFPSLAVNGDQVQLLWTAKDSIRYRFGWTNTENLSQPITIAACENPIASGSYLAWTKQDGYLSHLYYGAIPASGLIDPVEINYSTDLINYPQILFNPKKQNQTPSLDLIWTEYSQLDSLGYIYYLNLPLTEEIPVYSFDLGTETPVPVLVQRDGFLAYGSEDFKTIDYDSTELIYHLTLHSPHKKYKIKWTYYHQEPDKIKLDFSIDDILHHNRWVNPCEQVIQETWIPDSCLADNEITIKVKKLSGSLAVLSGFEIYEQIVGGGGPQGSEIMISRPFSMDRIYPNPVKGMIKIRFNSPDERQVIIKLYDVTGRLVNKLFANKAHTGMNEVPLKTGELANGIYFIKLEADAYCKVEKVVFLK
ncbi:MAG TPA: C25 family cysteine peptidase [bacterium]